MIFECWQALVKMEKGINDLFKRQQIPYLIDKVLVAITSTIAKKPLNEVNYCSFFMKKNSKKQAVKTEEIVISYS